MTNPDRPDDNSRLTMRITAHRTLAMWADLASSLDLDLIEMLVFTGIWTANTEHLNRSTERYARLLDLPPDSQRRPISVTALANRMRLPHELCAATAQKLMDRRLVEQASSGLLVPAAVFTRQRMLDALTEGFIRVRELGLVLSELNPLQPAD